MARQETRPNHDQVESDWRLLQTPPASQDLSGSRDPLLGHWRHRENTGLESRARLDLHDNENAALPGRHVDLAMGRAQPMAQYAIALRH